MAERSTAFDLQAREGWQAVDAILDDLERLAAKSASEQEFYVGLWQALSALSCAEACVWIADDAEKVRLAWHAPTQGNGNGHRSQRSTDELAIASTIHSKKIAVNQRSITAPWAQSNGPPGALQVWLAASVAPSAVEGYGPLIAAVGEIIANFLARQQQTTAPALLGQQTKLDAFNQSLHESLDVEETAYRIANDGRLLVGCDRLSVVVQRSGRYKAVAVSGADHVHRRSESAQQLQRLCQAVSATGQPVWHGDSPRDLPPQVAGALQDYLDVSPARWLGVVPLISPHSEDQAALPPVGALVFEQYERPLEGPSRDIINAMISHCRLALSNALRVDAIPGHRWWLARSDGWPRRWMTRTTAVVGALATVVALLVLIPADIRVKARGELQPAVRSEVFAPRDGIVTEILVDHGQRVAAGEKLLTMRSPELDLELQRVAGELETARKRLAATQSERLQIRPGDPDARVRQRRVSAEEEQLQQQVGALEERRAMLQRQLEELVVCSPVKGEVITWNIHEQLSARPLKRGDALLTVADPDGPWHLELHVPSRQAGRLVAARRDTKAAQDVSFTLTTNPGTVLHGAVKEVAPRVEIDSSGESYLVATVAVPRDEIANRVPGTTALARIHCGRGSLGQAWFGDLLDAARLWLPF